ncbi:uncharacterized protein LOC6526142 isoform X1 [Drosophila yakuba]|uniref:Voltage-dependent calcium channel gamma-5 subunit n=1 Tax=Drosophila yakuba TaxID=7245 RepID=B4PYM3_DROYA|nr:uncharacterized protein LOC6526142 isoform X1 [Drosophila yakuba]EDX03064.2 uncharacterized protein Dyak_GE17906 [Drosophila yakuba]
MRDYPSVPNVFRVASTHSINSENPYNNIRPANVNCNTTERQPLAIHQLTTSASIEHSHPSQQPQHQQQPLLHHPHPHQQQQQRSPYATLPRGQRLAPQQQHQQTGLINTISGSIPATGFSSLAGSFSDLHLNNIGNHSSHSRSNHNHNHNHNSISISNNQRQQQQQQQQQLQRLVPPLSRHQPAIEVQQTQQHQQHQQTQQHQQHQQTQQQHVQRQQQHRAGAPDPQGGNISNMTTVNGGYLWLITPVAASISVAIVIAALAGPQWLFTEEKLPNANYNGTANFKALDDGAYITKYTKSSLWILCTTLPGLDAESYNCVKIDYFSNEGYQPDPHDSTAAIPYTVTKSCPIFLAAGVFLVISFIVFLIPTCSHQNNLYYFSAGILFIVSGLVMLIGLIAYISILKAEIGSKLRPRSTLQPALIKVSYGQSFFLFVFGFIVTEFVGVLNIFLFINLQEVSYYSRLPCFSVANIHAKFKEGQHPLSDSYKRYKQPGTITASQEGLSSAGQGHQGLGHHTPHNPQPAAQPPHGILRSGNSRLHQVHDAGRGHPGIPGQIGHPGQTQTLPGACRKHPNAGSNLNLYLHNDLERRFYFEKPAVSKCNLHSRSFAKSLNELCTDTYVSSTHVTAPLPAPPAPSAANPLPAPALFADLPQEFPLTRSISTATEIYPAPTSAPAPPSAQMKRKQQRNMATNTNTKISNNPPTQSNPHSQLEDQSRLCGLKRGLRKTKDELFQEFCRRAGMRSKPKNIYYISGGDEAEEEEQEQEQEDQAKREEAPDIPHRDDDDDADGDDHGFRQFNRIEEDHLYVVGDHAQLVVPRRTSMCVDSMGKPLRRLNSNLSLHTDLSFPATGGYPGGVRMSLPQPADLGQSRTLPRCFLRQSSDSLASQGFQLDSSQQRFSQLMLNQHQNRFVSSTLTLPQVVAPKSQVQWPTAIPSSPSNYSNGYQQHPQPIYPAAQLPTSGAPGASVSAPVSGPPKFQRGYAFDDQQRRSSYVSDAFDLDEIERERRRSHASLFGMGQVRDPYDLINGTAV